MFAVLGAVLLSLSLHVQAELRVGFTEVDYYESESEGCLAVAVFRDGQLSKDVVISIHPMTYLQFAENNLTLPDLKHFQHLPDPAEYENGREDFSITVKRITLRSELPQEVHQVCIDINPDAINEANEGFLLVLSIDRRQSNTDVIINDGGVAVGVIMDDDQCPVMFERSSYVLSEGAGQKRTDIALVKDASVQTEQEMAVSVIMDLARGTAVLGKDYRIDFSEGTPTRVWFEPGIHRVVVPISIIEDDMPETQEQFELLISAPSNGPLVVIPTGGDHAVVNILDNDAVSVSFTEESYTCSESDQEECELCVSILSPDKIDKRLFIFLRAVSVPGTAETEVDFVKYNESLLLFNLLETMCFTVNIHNDNLVEGVESFQLFLSADSLSESFTLVLVQPTTTVFVLDDDMISVGFEQQSYTCREGHPEGCVLCIAILSPTPVAENLAISLFVTTHSSTATAGEDYMDTNDTVILSRESQKVCVVVYVWDDSIAERDEAFQCGLLYSDYFHFSNLDLDRAVTTIVLEDNDVVSVGFERDDYTCKKSLSEICEVCISLLSSAPLDNGLFVSLSVTTTSATAEAERDFIAVNDTVELSALQKRVCIPVLILEDDSVDEGEMYFRCILSLSNSLSNLKLERDVATITILDNINVDSCLGVDGHAVCHEKAICHDELEGGVHCECMDGYMGDGFTTCTDVNECVAGLDDCDHNIECTTASSGSTMCGPVASCINTDGSYQCTCNAAYTGDGRTCKAIESHTDECEEGTHTCHPNADCIDTEEGFLCECRQGYQGDGVECTDVDECVSDVHDCDSVQFCHYAFTRGKLECIHASSCTNIHGGYLCSCKTGFTGDGITCQDIDECEGVTECSADARCHNIPGSYHCKCNKGFHGDGILCTATVPAAEKCSEGTHDCDPNADCIDIEEGYTCHCQPGFTGNGQVCRRTAECSSGQDVCSYDAECKDIEGVPQCVCKTGYEGDGFTCTDINECMISTMAECGLNAVCENISGSYRCRCADGYHEDGITCIRILVDECALGTHDCQRNSHCVDEEDGYSCVCNSGYDGNICVDIDECALGLHECSVNGVCVNEAGSYYCVCSSGYDGDGFTCSDVNECMLEKTDCSPNAECENRVGSYVCHCLNGYEGDGFICTDINECTSGSHVCDDTAMCLNSRGSYQCQCNEGYVGDGVTCTRILVDECALGTHDCQRNSHCVDEEDGYSCVCNSGYRRDDRNICIDIDECEIGRDSCDKTEVCIGESCVRVGVCSNRDGSFQCSCRPGFRGDGHSCSDIDECSLGLSECSVYSYCVNVAGSYKCQCTTGYEHVGHVCQDINECKRQLHDCDTHALCTNTLGGFQCMCKKGYLGNGTNCHPTTPSNPCEKIKNKGYAYWRACRNEQKLHKEVGHENSPPTKPRERGGWKGDYGDDDEETTGIHHSVRVWGLKGAHPQTGPWYKGEQNGHSGVGGSSSSHLHTTTKPQQNKGDNGIITSGILKPWQTGSRALVKPTYRVEHKDKSKIYSHFIKRPSNNHPPTRLLQKGQGIGYGHQGLNVDKYQEILDSWPSHRSGETYQEGTKQFAERHDSGPEPHYQQQVHQKHTNKKTKPNHIPRLRLSTWPHPLTEAHTLKGLKSHDTAQKHNGPKHHVTKTHSSISNKQNDEDVWFRVPGGIAVKLSQKS